ncbi:MAG: sodium:solute symporter [Bacteroidetes bacterium]|nr:sodium:solute symporter [Bacteroidota bacterium]
MSPVSVLIIISLYFLVLLSISWFTGRNADNESFFLGNKRSPWYIVAFGMIGASLSGVTFISVPGWVGLSQFSYLQVVLGYLVGYLVIGTILMPLYYKLNLTSIYTYLQQRFGTWAHKTGVLFFLASRTFGAAARLFIVASVIQLTVLDAWHVPFAVTVIITILLIYLYTNRGGIKTIIWTDTLQTLFMLSAVVISVILISKNLELDFKNLFVAIADSEYSRVFFFNNWQDKNFFWKHFLGGAFIAIAMTGLDQDMMQKNLSCKNIEDAKKNMFWFSVILVPVNLLFLGLGALLILFASKNGISLPADSDQIFPLIATGGFLSPVLGLFFIIGIVAAAYSSADSALTALTTSFSVDILNVSKYPDENKKERIRKRVHIGYSILLLFVILGFKVLNNSAVIDTIFVVAGYTYGPLLGLFSFGMLTKRKLPNSFIVTLITLISPLICYFISLNAPQWFGGYQFGYELLILNGVVTFMGLFLISKKTLL